MATVLVVDDDAGIRESAVLALQKVGHRLLSAEDAQSALEILGQHRVDVVVSDIYMPGDDGLALLRAISERRDPPRVILITARGTIETTALAQRIGAFDYLAKPFDLSELIDRVGAAARKSRPESADVEEPPPSRIIGTHPSMIEMYKAIARVAPLSVPVLVLGESGSGKELVAQSIHDLGDRASGPFLAINCGAIPDTLLESELFGSVRGAFTDARHDRRGALSRADGGTLFLDEIGDISPAFQVKLLRFLQDGVVTPLGSEKSHRVSVRVVAATHRDLRERVAAGHFREDLYYRLAGYEIAVPPLRNRRSDIPMLVEHFRRRIAQEMRRDDVPGPSQGVLDLLSAYAWPGNVRQLEQVVRRVVIDTGGLVDADAVARELRNAGPSVVEEEVKSEPRSKLLPLDEAEKRHILAVLRATGGNQTQAAFILGIERKTLARKMKRLDISMKTLFALLLVCVGLRAFAATDYRFDDVDRTVVLKSGAQKSPAVVGQHARGGDKVETGWFSHALIASDTHRVSFELFSSTEVTLAEGTPGVILSLDRGRIRAAFDKILGSEPRVVKTPGALLAVRGTKFDVRVDREGETTVDVFEGVVEVQSPLRPDPMFVRAGQESIFGRSRPPVVQPMPEHRKREGEGQGQPPRGGNTHQPPQGSHPPGGGSHPPQGSPPPRKPPV